jgi:hypothetical protein
MRFADAWLHVARKTKRYEFIESLLTKKTANTYNGSGAFII